MYFFGKFLNEFLASIKPMKNKNDNADEDFRRKYRRDRCLTIDDIQFFSLEKLKRKMHFFPTLLTSFK